MNGSNLGVSIGRRGLCAPGIGIVSLGPEGHNPQGTSVAVPFVTGTIALLWSEFPAATATDIKFAVTHAAFPRRTSIVPPLLNAAAAYQLLLTTNVRAGHDNG
jgi:subtilisin family serine protease